jgi:hypothetical protein
MPAKAFTARHDAELEKYGAKSTDIMYFWFFLGGKATI